MTTHTTFVSSYFDLSQIQGNSKTERPSSVPELLKCPYDFVFFGDEDECLNVWKIRRLYGLLDKTFCVSMNIENLPDWQHLDTLRKVCTDISSSYTPEQIVLSWSKMYFLKKASDLKPFEITTHFCWVDYDVLDTNKLGKGDSSINDVFTSINTIWSKTQADRFRICYFGTCDENLYLDSRKFYESNIQNVYSGVMGGSITSINQMIQRLDKQKIYSLKISKSASIDNILSRLMYFFAEDFDLINQVNHDQCLYNFGKNFADIHELINKGVSLRNAEKLKESFEILSKIAIKCINGTVLLTVEQIKIVFYELIIAAYYVNYTEYKYFRDWFKDYYVKNNISINDNFKMNLGF